MDRTTPTTHAGHDELLVARLYGGDLDAAERDRAQDLLAECPDCAALFADLGAIARATAALPVPARPRDFTLTAADAARLGAGRRRWPGFLRPELRRSVGGAVAALGLAGVVLTSGFSVFGGSASTTLDASSLNAPAADQALAGVAASLAAAPQPAATAAPASSGDIYVLAPLASPAAPVAAGSAGSFANDAQGSAASPEPSGRKAMSSGNPEFAQTGGSGTEGDGHSKTSEAASTLSGGMDPRLVWLIGFGVLFGIGLAILILPSLLRRRGRGSRN